LSDDEEDLEYLDDDSYDEEDDDKGQVSNIAFNTIVKKGSTHENNDSDSDINDDIDNENGEHEKLVIE
jgi:hypothetical protein